MGLTHYWDYGTHSPDLAGIWPGFLSDVRRIVDSVADQGIGLAGPDGTGDPEILESGIAFNGQSDDEEDYESFCLAGPGTRLRATFCKTGQRPYDTAVTAVLLRLKTLYPGIFIKSDGQWEEWQAARDINEQLFGTRFTGSLLEAAET